MTQLVYLNVLISLYEFNIWLDGYIWWKFCVNSPLRNPLTDKNADVSNTYFPRCMLYTAVALAVAKRPSIFTAVSVHRPT